MSSAEQPQNTNSSQDWVSRSFNYGNNNAHLSGYIESIKNWDTEVEVTEVDQTKNPKIIKKMFHDIPSLRDYFLRAVDESQKLRTISVSKLSGGLLMLLGAKFDMDYETWTSRLFSSDREYFASPLSERGPKNYSHFNLGCVDFFRATTATPDHFLVNRRIDRTVRLMKFLKLKQDLEIERPRVYVIRRVSGHLRFDGHLWTFLFFCEPFGDFELSGYRQDIIGESMPPISGWVAEAINTNTSDKHLQRIGHDGYGLVVKILRDIKSTWKLLLSEMENFLEEMNETFNEEDFIAAAPYLHREFILYIDFFQRQMFYHQRHASYLITHEADPRYIYPTEFRADFSQENDAMAVLNNRMKVLRQRTTTILDLILNLATIKQARLSGQILLQQREEAKRSYMQGEVLRQLTILNMFYLPPSFVATVYGMNTQATQHTQIWTFVLIALFFTCTTMLLVYATFRWESKRTPISSQGEGQAEIDIEQMNVSKSRKLPRRSRFLNKK